jgi:hypothetical protein
MERLGVRGGCVPSLSHLFLEVWQAGPKVLEFEGSWASRPCLISQQKRAVIRMGGGQCMESAVFKSHIPVLVAEETVKTDQGRAATFVAPRKLPVLQMDLFQPTGFQCAPELAHKSKVEVPVVLVASSIYYIEASQDEPFLYDFRC